MSSLSPCHTRYSRAGAHPGKLRHQRGSPRSFLRGCAGDLLQLWGLSPCIPQGCLLWEGMCRESSARALPLHLPPNSLVLHPWLMGPQLSGVTRDSKSHPRPLGSRIPQWEPARIHLLSVSIPWGNRGRCSGCGDPRNSRGSRGELAGTANPAGWVGLARGGGRAGTLPSCPSVPPARSQPSYGIIHSEVWLLLAGLIEELVITSP